MADLITIKAGQRIRIDGQSYEVAENTDTRADAVEVQPQKNRHFLVTCLNPTCVADNGGKPLGYRAPRKTWEKGLPPCGCCGGNWPDGTKHTMEPSGWSLTDATEDTEN